MQISAGEAGEAAMPPEGGTGMAGRGAEAGVGAAPRFGMSSQGKYASGFKK